MKNKIIKIAFVLITTSLLLINAPASYGRSVHQPASRVVDEFSKLTTIERDNFNLNIKSIPWFIYERDLIIEDVLPPSPNILATSLFGNFYKITTRIKTTRKGNRYQVFLLFRESQYVERCKKGSRIKIENGDLRGIEFGITGVFRLGIYPLDQYERLICP